MSIFDILYILSKGLRFGGSGCAPILKILSEKPKKDLSDKCLLISDSVFHMPGVNLWRLWIHRLPGQGLFLFLFHTTPPSGGCPPKTGCAVFSGLCNGRDTVHPHRLYSKRGGRQIAAPTFKLFQITVYSTCLLLNCSCKIQKT